MAIRKKTARTAAPRKRAGVKKTADAALALNPSPEQQQVFLSRHLLSTLAETTFGTDRNLRQALGYVDEKKFDANAFAISRYWYERGDVAGRILDIPVNATWTDLLEIRDADDDSEPGPFVYDDLNSRWKLTRRMTQVDRLAGLGRYAVLLIGVARDGEDLSQPPMMPVRLDQVAHLTPYAEPDAAVKEWDSDPGSPRFGQPLVYELRMLTRPESGARDPKPVHWSRVLHVSDGGLDNDLFAVPRLKRVLNQLGNKEKIIGAAAEIFWQSADRFFAILDDEGKFEETEVKAIRDNFQKMLHELSRIFVGSGIKDIKTFAGNDVRPKEAWEAVRQLIAAAAGIPERILFGSERGELASTQDRQNWADRVNERRTELGEPWLRDLFDRLIVWGALPIEPYQFWWPPVSEPLPEERAETRVKNSQAVKNMAEAGASVDDEVLENEYDLKGFSFARLPSAEREIESEEGDVGVPPQLTDDVRPGQQANGGTVR